MPPKQRPKGKRKPPPPTRGGRRPTTQGGLRELDARTFAAAVGGLLVVVALVVVFVVVRDDGSVDATGARSALEAAGCQLREVDALRGDHSVEEGGTSEAWNTDPPTSGPHFPETAFYGAYTEPLDQARLVHNLEHGAVFIQYGEDVPEETVAELRAFYDDNQRGTLLAPLPRLGSSIALGAWTFSGGEGTAYLANCTTFDDTAYSAFLDAFQFRGPERFSPDSMLPGRP